VLILKVTVLIVIVYDPNLLFPAPLGPMMAVTADAGAVTFTSSSRKIFLRANVFESTA
jgi:hypothetical protein